MAEKPLPPAAYSIRFDPLKKQYIASNGIIGVPVRQTIGWELIQKTSQQLGNPLDDEGQRKISSRAAEKVFEYIEKFT